MANMAVGGAATRASSAQVEVTRGVKQRKSKFARKGYQQTRKRPYSSPT